MSQELRADSILASLELLYRRIDERFPGWSLGKVCADLIGVAKRTERRARRAGRPDGARFIRNVILILALALVSFYALLAPLFDLPLFVPTEFDDSFSVYDIIEALTGVLIVIFAAGFWIVRSGTRAKRKFVFGHLHELRSFAHVIDMHQLTKDPITLSATATRTASSPERSMTPFELARYLDYCAEMLSLTGKLAALYGEQTSDTEITTTVNEIETLTAGISRKIWQKIMMLDNDVIARA